MAQAVSDLEWAARLSGQLELLSEFAENLTYRVLELEERLVQQGEQVSSLQSSAADLVTELGTALEERLQGTEDRLARMEGLLAGTDRSRRSMERPLRALPGPAGVGSHFHRSPKEAEEEAMFLEDNQGEAFLEEQTHGEETYGEDVDLLDQDLAS